MTPGAAPHHLAQQSRRLYAEQLIKGLPALIAAVGESARRLMDKPSEPATALRRRELVQALTRHAGGWHKGMTDGLRQVLTYGLSASRPADLPAPGRAAGAGLTLVDDDTIEREILTSRLALAIMDRASWEFTDLRSRVASLEQRQGHQHAAPALLGTHHPRPGLRPMQRQPRLPLRGIQCPQRSATVHMGLRHPVARRFGPLHLRVGNAPQHRMRWAGQAQTQGVVGPFQQHQVAAGLLAVEVLGHQALGRGGVRDHGRPPAAPRRHRPPCLGWRPSPGLAACPVGSGCAHPPLPDAAGSWR